MGNALGMAKRSKVHPSHKTLYWVTNWSQYDRGLLNRGIFFRGYWFLSYSHSTEDIARTLQAVEETVTEIL